MAVTFVGTEGDFILDNADQTSGLYFPLCAPNGLKAAVTPQLGGDSKQDQSHFVLLPASVQELEQGAQSRNFWLRLSNGRCWSATGCSAPQQAASWGTSRTVIQVEAGLLWHRLHVTQPDFSLRSHITSWIAPDMPNQEIHHIVIENTGTAPVSFTPTAAVPLYGRSADNIRDHRHVTSLLHRARAEAFGVTLKPTWSFDERGHLPNEKTYFVLGMDSTGAPPVALCMDRLTFTGEGGNLLWPKWVVCQQAGVLLNSHLDGREVVAALRFAEICVNPNETAEYWLVIGAGQEDAPQLPLPEQLRDSLRFTKQWWQAAGPIRFAGGIPRHDALMRWVGIQPVLRRIYGCSFLPHHDYGRGGRGWRDLWQDSLGLLLAGQTDIRTQLAAYCGGMRTDGTNATIIGEQPGEFIADRNHITRVWMDHAFWPILTIHEYIQATGDLSLLLKTVPYFDDGLVMRGAERCSSYFHEPKGTVVEHLLIGQLTAILDRGAHGALRLRGADWNDALDMAQAHGESVAFSFAYIYSTRLMTQLLEYMASKGTDNLLLPARLSLLIEQEDLPAYCRACADGQGAEKAAFPIDKVAQKLCSLALHLAAQLQSTEWLQAEQDGWFNSYYDETGVQAEDCTPHQERMMLTGQVFALLSGVASEKQATQIAAAAQRLLFTRRCGGYRLNTDFGNHPNHLGRQFAFAYGTKENGAVFSHMAVMYAYALYQRGLVQEGWDALSSLFDQALDFENSRIYPGIPEYFDPQGRGAYHYLTGAAAWIMYTMVQQVYGLQGEKGALRLSPKLLAPQFDTHGQITVQLPFGGLNWTVTYHNPHRLNWGEYRIQVLLDEQPLEAPLVPLDWIQSEKPGSVHDLQVRLEEI